MEREIKFRAYWPGVNQMKYFVPGNFEDTPRGWAMTFVQPGEGGTIFIGKAEIMQYTGLKDKNGKEIYEGDIVEIKTVVSHSDNMMDQPEDYDQTIICKVFFNEAIACFDLKTIQRETHLSAWGFYGDNMDSFEIIGNIHQNPELLTQ